MLLSLGLSLTLAGQSKHWGQLGSGGQAWTLFKAAYAIALPVSGFRYCMTGRAGAGFLHAGLMFGVAGIAFVKALDAPAPGRDDASAWVVAWSNLVLDATAWLTLLSGVLILVCLISEPPKTEEGKSPT